MLEQCETDPKRISHHLRAERGVNDVDVSLSQAPFSESWGLTVRC